DGQAGVDDGGELAREDGDVAHVGDAADVEPLGQLDLGVEACLGDLDLGYEVALLTQGVGDLALRRRLRGARDHLAAAITDLVVENRHPASTWSGPRVPALPRLHTGSRPAYRKRLAASWRIAHFRRHRH